MALLGPDRTLLFQGKKQVDLKTAPLVLEVHSNLSHHSPRTEKQHRFNKEWFACRMVRFTLALNSEDVIICLSHGVR